MNKLYYGDNLPILQQYFPPESVDLIYLDPPFNSNRNYNVLFKDDKGQEAAAQITAFKDTWQWDITAEKTYYHLIVNAPSQVAQMLEAMLGMLGRSSLMAYLVMMTARLIELHRILKPTGSLYLHCDPTASHYLKLLLDTIFGAKNFRCEIIWKRTSAHNDAKQGAKQPGRVHDTLFFYTKSEQWVWNPHHTPYSDEYKSSAYSKIEPETGRSFKTSDLTAAKGGGDVSYEWRGQKPPEGRYWAYSRQNMERFEQEGRIYYSQSGKPYLKQYLDEMPGLHIQSVWTDIPPLSAASAEKMGYPTQKPLSLLERIILCSSNEGDVVLDPFCGCGTAVAAAQKLNRQWLSIDNHEIALNLQKQRLKEQFGLTENKQYQVINCQPDLADILEKTV